MNCNAYNTYAVYQLSVNDSKSVWLNHTNCDKECVATIAVSEFLTTDHQLITVKAYSSLNANATERSTVIGIFS